MRTPSDLYRHSLALLTDLYQLTMAYGYWRTGRADLEAVFHQTFRRNPYKGGFAVACGLDCFLDLIEHFRFDAGDLEYLATLRGNDGAPLFEPAFLDYLGDLRLAVDVDAMPEGTVVFPHEPLVRVRGPILHCQILETALLNIVNFQTLVATKAARLCIAAEGGPILEFGLRRAQGIDGGLAASRAAFIGGVAATSNVLAGKLYDIPVRGTHAHSWVMSFADEPTAFRAYAEVMPNNCIFLVDTFDTIEGVRHAVAEGKALRARGYEMIGIRLDSGDLAWLSQEARRILDEGGFPDARIVASNDLDEHIIESLKRQGARVDIWGVGTRLATAFEEPALGGVYKLAAVRERGGDWQHKVKLSEQAVKISTPGVLQVRRYEHDGEIAGDAIWDEPLGVTPGCVIVDPMDHTRRKVMAEGAPFTDLLVPVVRAGRVVYRTPPLVEVRERTLAGLAKLPAGVKRFINPHQYPVGLEQHLHDLKTRLILEARGLAA